MHFFPSPLLFVFFKTLNILPNSQCDETFEKKCQITFRSKAVTEPVSSFLVVHYRRSQKKKLLSIKKRRSFCKYIFWWGQGKLKTRTNFEQQKTTKKQMTGVGESSQTDRAQPTYFIRSSISEWGMEILRPSCSYSNKLMKILMLRMTKNVILVVFSVHCGEKIWIIVNFY